MTPREIFRFLADVSRKGKNGSLSDFTAQFKKFGGFEHVIMTNSGRGGFRLLLETLDFKPGSEIIFPAYTFHPIPQAAAECGLSPVFADVDPATWNISPESVLSRVTNKTRAIVPTHLFGVPAPMEEILAISREHDLFVIEDCAHALGAEYRGKMVGNRGDAAIFTFAMSKNLPCWGGGAVVVKEPELAESLGNRIKAEAEPSSSSILRRQLPNIMAMLFAQRVIFPWTLYPALRLADFLGSDFFDRPFLEPVVPPRYPSGKRSAVSSEQLKEESKRSAVSGEQLKEKSKRLAVSGKQLKEESKRSAVSGKQYDSARDRLSEPRYSRDKLRGDPDCFLSGPLTAHRSLITPMSPLQAKTGLRQIKRFPSWLNLQIKNARRLRLILSDCPKLQLQHEAPDTQSSFLYVRARVDNTAVFRRALLRRGIDTKPDDMSNCAGLGIFEDQTDCPEARKLGGHCIELPCSPFYSERQIGNIAERVLAVVDY